MKMMNNTINIDYFYWLYDLVCRNRYSKDISYKNLLYQLHSIEFKYSIPFDENRAKDGIDLRDRYCIMNGYDDEVLDYLSGPCTVLEMMVALSIRCEETIMDDPAYGDRTGQWFWGMIKNLGLKMMTDNVYDVDYVNYVIETFLNRNYEPDGKGGLFRIRDCEVDLTTVEIWKQLCWYLNTIT